MTRLNRVGRLLGTYFRRHPQGECGGAFGTYATGGSNNYVWAQRGRGRRSRPRHRCWSRLL